MRAGARALSGFGEGAKFEDGVPVATRGRGSELPFDEGVRQARAADTVRVDEVRVFARGTCDLRTGDGGLQPFHALDVRRLLQKNDAETGGIALGFPAEEIGRASCRERV